MKLTRRRRFHWALHDLNTALTSQGHQSKSAWHRVQRWGLWRWVAWGLPVAVGAFVVWMWCVCQ